MRLLIMPFTSHPFDVYSWYSIMNALMIEGIDMNFILSSLRPLWIFTLVIISYIYNGLLFFINVGITPINQLPNLYNPYYDVPFITDILFNFIVKFPMLLSDIGSTAVLYYLVKEYAGQSKAELIPSLYFLNPVLIWISAVWGQYESIIVFFTLLSIYYILKKKILLSSICLLTASLYKYYALIVIIPIFLYLKKNDFYNLFKYMAIFIVSIIFLVIIGKNQLINSFMSSHFIVYLFSENTFHGLFGYGLTYWSLSLIFNNIPYILFTIPLILMFSFLIISLYSLVKSEMKFGLLKISLSTFLLMSSIFLSHRYIGETRYIFLVPFLIIMVIWEVIPVKYYYAITTIAFIYSIKTLPYFFLPLVSLNNNIFKVLFLLIVPFKVTVDNVIIPSKLGGLILGLLGTLFSFIILKICIVSIRKLLIIK